MPFVEPTIRPLFAGAAATPEPEKPNFFTETIPAAFRTENMIGSLFSRESGVPALIQAPQGDFNPFEHIEGYEDRARSFTNANTLNEVEALKRQIDRERNDRETLAASGIGGFVAAIGAGVVDPTVFIPVGGALKKGESLLRVTARTAAAAGLSTAVQEVGLNATQEERTLAESGLNIAGATVLGGVLGAGFGALSKAQQARLAKQFEQDMRAPVGDIDAADPFASAPAKVSGGGLSADVVSRETLGDVVGVAKPLLDVARTIDPTLSLATARSQNVRSLGAALAESPLLREANIVKTQKVEIAPGVFEDRHVFRETPQAVESAIRRKSERRMGEGIQILDDAYQGYVFGSHKRTITPKLRAGLSALTQTGDGAGKLRPREFEREVWKALARGDKSDIPEVAQAAQAIRERVLKPLEDEAVELGMFGFDRIPPEVEGGAEKLVPRRPSAGQTAESYRPRLYDHAKIKARRPEFEDKLFNFYRRERDAAKARAAAGIGEAEDAARGEVDDAFLKENAVRTVDRILSTPVGRLTYDAEEASSGLGPKKGGSLSGRFHARRLLLPDSEIEEFLDDDLNYMLRNVSRSMTADIELMRTFGSVDLDAQFKGIADEYAQMARDVDPKAPDAEQQRKAIADEQAQVIRNVAGIRDRLRGTYALPEDPSQIGYRVINGFKALNHLRLMGGVTLSSIPDTARVVFSNGMGNFAGVAMERLVTAVKRTKIPAGKELEFAGTAFELVNDSRTAALSDILDNYGRGSKFERALGAAQSNFGQLSLMAPWNHAMKSAAGLTTQNRILSAARALAEGKAKKNDLQFVARLGIGESDLRKMAKAFNEFGEDNGRVLWANTEAWTDRRLADMFHNAMRAETDRIIVQPGQEKPLWASGPIGSLIFQFQSYNFAATQRVVLAGVQGLSQRDMTVVSTIVGQVALGMLVAKLKMEQAGRGEETAAWSGRRWIAEGVDRSGMLGALTYVNLASERLTGGRIGLSALAGKEPLSRYNSRNALGTFLGPTAGLAQDAFTVSAATARALADGEPVTDGDIAALRRLLPYQNLFYVRQLFDQMETALGSDKFTDAEP